MGVHVCVRTARSAFAIKHVAKTNRKQIQCLDICFHLQFQVGRFLFVFLWEFTCFFTIFLRSGQQLGILVIRFEPEPQILKIKVISHSSLHTIHSNILYRFVSLSFIETKYIFLSFLVICFFFSRVYARVSCSNVRVCVFLRVLVYACLCVTVCVRVCICVYLCVYMYPCIKDIQ